MMGWSASTGPGYGPGRSTRRRCSAARPSGETARCAAWADGLITVNADHEQLRRPIDAYRERRRRTTASQVHVSWAPDEAQAEAIAHEQWRSNVFRRPPAGSRRASRPSMPSPRTSDRAGAPGRADLSDLGWHTAQLAAAQNWVSTRSPCTTSVRGRTSGSRSWGQGPAAATAGADQAPSVATH